MLCCVVLCYVELLWVGLFRGLSLVLCCFVFGWSSSLSLLFSSLLFSSLLFSSILFSSLLFSSLSLLFSSLRFSISSLLFSSLLFSSLLFSISSLLFYSLLFSSVFSSLLCVYVCVFHFCISVSWGVGHWSWSLPCVMVCAFLALIESCFLHCILPCQEERPECRPERRKVHSAIAKVSTHLS